MKISRSPTDPMTLPTSRLALLLLVLPSLCSHEFAQTSTSPLGQIAHGQPVPRPSSRPRLQNLGLASGGVVAVPGVTDGVVVFYVNEFYQGADIDGNGTIGGLVLHTLDIQPGVTTNLFLNLAGDMMVDNGRAVFGLPENLTDLNGDGDTNDTVLHWIDTATKTITNTGVSMAGVLSSFG